MNRTFTKRAGVGEPGVVMTFEETGQYDLELDAAVTGMEPIAMQLSEDQPPTPSSPGTRPPCAAGMRKP